MNGFAHSARNRLRLSGVAALALLAGCAQPPAPRPLPERLERGDAWPSFRGPRASGVATGQNLPLTFDGESGENIRWKKRIPGLAHSSPIVWGDRLFVTTAVSGQGEAEIQPGLYGDGDASDDRSVHRWQVLALDKHSGEVLWQQTAHEGVPRDKRHIKATYANSTPATDGRYVVALFGSEGLYAYELDGHLRWQRSLGRLDMGAYDAPDYEWGSASSPIIHEDRVIVQCDTQDDSFLIALDVHTGKTVWRTRRDEPPSWGTPTVFREARREVLVANGSNFIRGYDPRTGEELWRLGGSSRITAPTPIFDAAPGGLLFVASGRRPEKPIFALRPGARGDITPGEGETSGEFVAWSRTKRGPYMPTPLLYEGYFYVLGNAGILDCYEASSGREVYRQRIEHSGSGFSASPVAADGRIYLPGEDGDVFVVRAGPEFELLSTGTVPEILMASPAISEGLLYLRAKQHLYAVGAPHPG